MSTTATIPRMELYMIVKDAELIRRMMKTHTPKPITARQITRALGFKGHSYMNRVLSGEQRTVKVDTANKIAYMLGVPVDLLFVAKASGDSQQNVRREAS